MKNTQQNKLSRATSLNLDA